MGTSFYYWVHQEVVPTDSHGFLRIPYGFLRPPITYWCTQKNRNPCKSSMPLFPPCGQHCAWTVPHVALRRCSYVKPLWIPMTSYEFLWIPFFHVGSLWCHQEALECPCALSHRPNHRPFNLFHASNIALCHLQSTPQDESARLQLAHL
jgi:hypothetical protein